MATFGATDTVVAPMIEGDMRPTSWTPTGSCGVLDGGGGLTSRRIQTADPRAAALWLLLFPRDTAKAALFLQHADGHAEPRPHATVERLTLRTRSRCQSPRSCRRSDYGRVRPRRELAG